MKNFIKKFLEMMERRAQDNIDSFNEQQEKEGAVEFVDHGIMTVDVEKIIGSVGKYHDFDSQFRPKRQISSKRFNDIKRAMRDGRPLPPVKLYQIRNDFYVLDGNHRVAAAKELGRDDIQAKVVELLSSQNTMENLLYIEKKKFFEKTGLPRTILLTEVGKYNFLESQIKKHKAHLAHISGDEKEFKKAAEDWYNTIYLPLTAIIKNGQLLRYFPRLLFWLHPYPW